MKLGHLDLRHSCLFPLQQENQLNEDEQENFKVFHRIKDHLLFHTITFLAKVIKECKIIRNPSRQEDLAGIWGESSNFATTVYDLHNIIRYRKLK